MTAGRPTKYKPEYTEMLKKHMAEGLSFESFAGVLLVTRSTIYKWVDEHEEFSDAKNAGQHASLLFWEKLNRSQAGGKIKSGSSNTIFTMKCRFGWREADVEQKDITVKLAYNLDED